MMYPETDFQGGQRRRAERRKVEWGLDQAISAADGAQAEAASLYRERALRAQLTGHRDALDVVAPELGLDGSAQYVCLVIRLVDRWRIAKHLSEEDGIRLSLRCEQICADAIAGRPGSVSFKNRISEFVVLLKDAAEADAEQTAQRIETALWNELTFHALAGLSGPFRPEALRSAYQEACAVIERRHFQEAASSAGDPVPSSPDGLRELAQTQLLGALLQGPEAVEALLRRIFPQVRRLSAPEQNNFMLFLLLFPGRTLAELNICTDSSYLDQRQLVEHWLSCPSLAEQEDFLRQILLESAGLLRQNRESGSGAVVRRVQAILAREYAEPLSVASLAERVHLTPAYLCTLFKQVTGRTIHEALTAERIDQAKWLLRDPEVRLRDVCAGCGYVSVSYFSRLFKKETGVTPGEYRDQVLGGG